MIITLTVIILCIANYIRLVQKQKSETYDIALVECGALQKPSYNIQKEFYRFLTAGFVHFYSLTCIAYGQWDQVWK